MKQNKETLKEYFETGDKPTQQQYSDLIDSYVDSKQPEGEANRRFVIDEKGEVSVVLEKTTPVYTLSDIVANKLSLLKDGEVIKEIDLTTYVDDTNLARLVSGTVNENGLATFTRDDNSMFTVDLSNLKGVVPQYQAGTNISIDSKDPQNPIINANGGSGGVITDLSYNSTTRTIGSSTGEGAVLPLVNTTNAGLMKADFYEEGTFNPIFSDNGGGATYTYSGPRRGTYVRVGNTVTFNIEFGHVYTAGIPTGLLFLLGLPFPLGSQPLSSANQGFSAVNVSDFTNTDLINIRSVKGNIRTLSSAPTIVFHVSTDSSIKQTLATSITLNNSFVTVSGTYITNVYTP